MNCYTHYTAELPTCLTSIEVRAHLTADAEYTWFLRYQRHGIRYQGTATADANGTFTIDTTDSVFPTGLFATPGTFELTVKRDPAQCGNSPMTICTSDLTSDVYAAAAIVLAYHPGSSEVGVVGCTCGDVAPEDPDVNASLVFNYTSQGTFTIAHNLGRAVQVSVYDSAGVEIHPSITIVDNNTVQISISPAISGTVVID